MILQENNTRMIINHEWQDWTPQAIECYTLQCDCARCSVYNLLEEDCLMYKAVAELLKTKGKPKLKIKDKYFRNLDDNEIKVIDAIIEGGCRNKQEIMQKTGLNDGMTQLVLGHLYVVANTYGCKFETARLKFDRFMNFVLKKFKGIDYDYSEDTKKINDSVYMAIKKETLMRKKQLFQKRKIRIKIGNNY